MSLAAYPNDKGMDQNPLESERFLALTKIGFG